MARPQKWVQWSALAIRMRSGPTPLPGLRIRLGCATIPSPRSKPIGPALGSIVLLQVTPDLSRLLAAVDRGDRAAFKALYDHTAAKLLGVVLRIVRDRALAEEVIQDTYLRIWRRAADYTPDAGQPLTWMVAIARHRAIDIIRKRTEVLPGPDDEGRDWLESVSGADDLGAEFVARDALKRCLNRLEPTQRDCIVLAYCGGYSREELAACFERPVNTIKTWLHRGLRALKACLDAP